MAIEREAVLESSTSPTSVARVSVRERVATVVVWLGALVYLVVAQDEGPGSPSGLVVVGVLVAAVLAGAGFAGWHVAIFLWSRRDAFAPEATDRLEALGRLRRIVWLSGALLGLVLTASVWVLAAHQPGDLRVAAMVAAVITFVSVSFLAGVPPVARLTVTWLDTEDRRLSAGHREEGGDGWTRTAWRSS
jgi:hypothetical protein